MERLPEVTSCNRVHFAFIYEIIGIFENCESFIQLILLVCTLIKNVLGWLTHGKEGREGTTVLKFHIEIRVLWRLIIKINKDFENKHH